MCNSLRIILIFGCLMAFGCASAERAAPHSMPGEASASPSKRRVERLLRDALASPPGRELKIEAECRTDQGFVSSTVYGHGVAFWDRRIQTTLHEEAIRRLLAAFERHAFFSMRDRYGGKGDPEPPARLGLELVCRVRLQRGAVEMQVIQLEGGRQHPPLYELAGEILAAVEARRGEGVEAASLGDGLAKVAAGELAPEALSLRLLEQPERPGDGGATRSLGLAGGRLEITDSVGVEPRARWLDVDELRELARALGDEEVEAWPNNLFAETYIDVSIAVLGFEKSVQARGFAGQSRETHGESQRRFERALARLRRLGEASRSF